MSNVKKYNIILRVRGIGSNRYTCAIIFISCRVIIVTCTILILVALVHVQDFNSMM